MALSVPTLTNALIIAFAATQWSDFSNQFADAVDAFVLSGTVTTSINATQTYPNGSTAPVVYTATGDPNAKPGDGITTTAKAGIVSACISAFASDVWGSVAGGITPSISSLLSTATVATTADGSPAIVGTGTGTIVPTGDSALQAALNAAFTGPGEWPQVASDIANAINTFVTTAIVNTTDTGNMPLASWSGTGIGSIS